MPLDPWLQGHYAGFQRPSSHRSQLAGYRLTESQGFPLHSSYLDGRSLNLNVPTLPRSRPPPPLQVAEAAASAGRLYMKEAGIRPRPMSGHLYDKPVHVDRLSIDVARFERDGVLHTSPERQRQLSPVITPRSKQASRAFPGGYNQIWAYDGASPSTRFGREPRAFNTTTEDTVFQPASLRLAKLSPAERASVAASPPKNGSRFQYLPPRHTLKLGHGVIGA